MKSIFAYLKQWIKFLVCSIRTLFMSHAAMAAEIIALRSQLALFEEQVIKKRLRNRKPTPHSGNCGFCCQNFMQIGNRIYLWSNQRL